MAAETPTENLPQGEIFRQLLAAPELADTFFDSPDVRGFFDSIGEERNRRTERILEAVVIAKMVEAGLGEALDVRTERLQSFDALDRRFLDITAAFTDVALPSMRTSEFAPVANLLDAVTEYENRRAALTLARRRVGTPEERIADNARVGTRTCREALGAMTVRLRDRDPQVSASDILVPAAASEDVLIGISALDRSGATDVLETLWRDLTIEDGPSGVAKFRLSRRAARDADDGCPARFAGFVQTYWKRYLAASPDLVERQLQLLSTA